MYLGIQWPPSLNSYRGPLRKVVLTILRFSSNICNLAKVYQLKSLAAIGIATRCNLLIMDERASAPERAADFFVNKSCENR